LAVVLVLGSTFALRADGEPENKLPSSSLRENKENIADLDLEQLDIEVVVTTSRREQALVSVPCAISVITSEDIRASGAGSIPDARRLAVGVDVADLSFSNAAEVPRMVFAEFRIQIP
jgi:outer membrane receptor protein involved in Fe transport